jgi:hypothetical protein
MPEVSPPDVVAVPAGVSLLREADEIGPSCVL